MDRVLASVPRWADENVLVGFDTADDAGVYKLTAELALVQTVDFGIYRFEADGWPFTFAPEVGVLIQSPNGPAFNVGIKFMYAVKSSDLEAQSDLLFNLGLVFGN